MIGTPGISDYNDYWIDRIDKKHYQFTDVHQKIVEVVKGILGTEKARVLDCGVGPGHVFKELSRLYETYGLEISDKVFSLYGFDTSRIQIWNLNNGLPSFNPPLDLIIASRIVHHLTDPVNFLEHLRKNLRINGWFVGVIPNICYYHHRIKFLFGKFPPISGAHVNFQTGPSFEKMVVEKGFALRQLTTPKKTIRAKFWPTVFSQDLIYVFQKSGT
jgi:SAM-dependent methyltransferase